MYARRCVPRRRVINIKIASRGRDRSTTVSATTPPSITPESSIVDGTRGNRDATAAAARAVASCYHSAAVSLSGAARTPWFRATRTTSYRLPLLAYRSLVFDRRHFHRHYVSGWRCRRIVSDCPDARLTRSGTRSLFPPSGSFTRRRRRLASFGHRAQPRAASDIHDTLSVPLFAHDGADRLELDSNVAGVLRTDHERQE